MSRSVGRDMLDGPVAQLAQVNAREKCLATAENHRSQGHVHLIDTARLDILADRLYASADLDILCTSCFPRLLQCSFNPSRTK